MNITLREVRNIANSMAVTYLNDYPWTVSPSVHQLEDPETLMEEWVCDELGIRLTPEVSQIIYEAIHLARYGMTIEESVAISIKALRDRRMGL